MAKHITDRAARKNHRAATRLSGSANAVSGPSTNPATNLLIQSIVLRGIGRLTRKAMEKNTLRRRYDRDTAKKIVDNRGLIKTAANYGVSMLATRSIPGAMVVGSGLLLKTLFDRSQSLRASRKAGDNALADQAEE